MSPCLCATWQGLSCSPLTTRKGTVRYSLVWPSLADRSYCVFVLLHLAPLLLLKGADGSDQLLYGQAAAAAAGGGLMESSYRNLQEAQVTLQAVYALMTAGEDLNSTPMFVHLGAYWLLLWPCSAINICGSTGWFIQS